MATDTIQLPEKMSDSDREIAELLKPEVGNQFGEFEDSGIGTDLTLEWDSTDAELHTHLRLGAGDVTAAPTDAQEAAAKYCSEWGIPDA